MKCVYYCVTAAEALRQLSKSALSRPADVAHSASLRHPNFARSATANMLAAAAGVQQNVVQFTGVNSLLASRSLVAIRKPSIRPISILRCSNDPVARPRAHVE